MQGLAGEKGVRPAIDLVTGDWPPARSQMDANLVRAAGHELAPHNRLPSVGRKDLVSRFARLTRIDDHDAAAILGTPGQWQRDCACVREGNPLDKRQVLFSYQADLGVSLNFRMDGRRQGDKDQAGRLLVEASDDAWYDGLTSAHTPQQCIEERS